MGTVHRMESGSMPFLAAKVLEKWPSTGGANAAVLFGRQTGARTTSNNSAKLLLSVSSHGIRTSGCRQSEWSASRKFFGFGLEQHAGTHYGLVNQVHNTVNIDRASFVTVPNLWVALLAFRIAIRTPRSVSAIAPTSSSARWITASTQQKRQMSVSTVIASISIGLP